MSCEAIHTPARTGHQGDLLDPIVCTAAPQFDENGVARRHRNKHRTTLPGGARLRWTDEESHK